MARKWDSKLKKMVDSNGRGRPVDPKVNATLTAKIGKATTGTFTVPVKVGANGPDITRAKVLSYCQRIAGGKDECKVKVVGFTYADNDKSATFTLK